MKRRNVLLGIAGLGVAGAWWSRPGDEGAPYDEYFRTLNAELQREGPMRPCMVIDLDRVDHNIGVITAAIRAPKQYRVVAKSIPCAGLIDYVFRKSGTRRLMAFHQPFLIDEAAAFADADILLGKPMPVRAAANFYAALKGPFDPSRQLQWLVDTPERLAQYLELANGLGTKLRINIEIDVGLHRGGVQDGATLDAMLKLIAANPQRLEFAGFMGYDPHVVKLPSIAGSVDELFRKSMAIYRGHVDFLRREHAALWSEQLTLNGAGSPTYQLHRDETLTNDISVGSALVQPTDFDVPTLAQHLPAAFIATPVLKASAGMRLPELDALSRLVSWWDPNQRQSYFIYGGYWMARYESPKGLRQNPLYGHSTNQEMANASAAVGLKVDDHVFLRPTQSEAVLLQFGDLIAVRGGKIVERWPVLQQGA